MIFFDTETVGLTSPLLTIQFAKNFNKPHFWSIWHQEVGDTLHLIKSFCDDVVVAWNLVFDWFQLTKWYNILYCYEPKDEIPDPYKVWEIEDKTPREWCLKPRGAIDPMIVARKNEFQYLMPIKPIKLRRIPRIIADDIIDLIIKNLNLPKGLKIKFIKTKNDKRPETIDIKCQFIGSTSLKYIHHIITGEKIYGTWEDFFPTIEFGKPYKPWGGFWQGIISKIQKHGYTEQQITYALRDVKMLQDCYLYLSNNEQKEISDQDSELTCLVGAARWKGYSINVNLAKQRIPPRNLNIPKASKAAIEYLSSVMDDNEKLVLINKESEKESTGKNILQIIKKWKTEDGKPHPAAERAHLILEERKADHHRDLLHKLIEARGLFPDLKVVGTLSNRMAGGSGEGTNKLGGSINPQGIDKVKWMRELFTLAWEDEALSAGDFKSFEISIMDAVWKDPKLHEELLTGKKMIALFGQKIYPELTYEQIIESDKEGEGSYYDRAKKGFYARSYGGQIIKLSTVFNLDRETTAQRLLEFDNCYPEIKKHYEKIEKDFMFFTPFYSWRDPMPYIETILGFRRYFTGEHALAKAIYNAMQSLPTEGIWQQKEIRRHDKAQTLYWATRSALCGALYTIQGRIIRQVGNFEIQSPGAEINKGLQHSIWQIQPYGIVQWLVRPMNVHDEQEVAHSPELADLIEDRVKEYVRKMKQYVPLLAIDWMKGIKNWSEKS